MKGAADPIPAAELHAPRVLARYFHAAARRAAQEEPAPESAVAVRASAEVAVR
jgi:hypothetical protein